MIQLQQIIDRLAPLDRDSAIRTCHAVARGLGHCLADAQLVARWLPEPLRETVLEAGPVVEHELDDELFEAVAAALDVPIDEAAERTHTFCTAVAELMTPGGISMLASHLPPEIAELFAPARPPVLPDEHHSLRPLDPAEPTSEPDNAASDANLARWPES